MKKIINRIIFVIALPFALIGVCIYVAVFWIIKNRLPFDDESLPPIPPARTGTDATVTFHTTNNTRKK